MKYLKKFSALFVLILISVSNHHVEFRIYNNRVDISVGFILKLQFSLPFIFPPGSELGDGTFCDAYVAFSPDTSDLRVEENGKRTPRDAYSKQDFISFLSIDLIHDSRHAGFAFIMQISYTFLRAQTTQVREVITNILATHMICFTFIECLSPK